MRCKNGNHSCNSCGEKKCGNKHTTCHNADVVPRAEVDEWKERVEVLERALEDAEDVLSFVLRWSDIHPQNQKIMRKTKQDFISYALCIKAAELKEKYKSEGER